MKVNFEACITLPGTEQVFSGYFLTHLRGNGCEKGVREGVWLVIITLLDSIVKELADERPGGKEGDGKCSGPVIFCCSHADPAHRDGQFCLSPLLVSKRAPYDPAKGFSCDRVKLGKDMGEGGGVGRAKEEHNLGQGKAGP